MTPQKLVTEFIGTFFLVLSIYFTVAMGVPEAVLATGAVIMALVYMGLRTSGAHYNPAVTLALVLRKALPAGELPGYWLAQLAGATLASLVGAWASGKEFGVHPDPATPWVTAFVLEFLFTFLLVLVVLNVASWTKEAGQVVMPLAVAATVIAALYATGPIASAALNPAVATGPVVLDGNLGSLGFYWGATLLAAAAAAGVYGLQERGSPAN